MLLPLLMMMSFTNPTTEQTSIHQFQIRALDSEDIIDFSDFAGKKIMVVNVASKCGFTNQYEELEQLYQAYQDQLVVIGFPSNQFLNQEPGSESDIATFCSTTYGVSFPMTMKVKVKGSDAHEIYQWLTQKDLNGKDDYKISWNFNKFLLDEEGKLMERFGTRTRPMDEEITGYLN